MTMPTLQDAGINPTGGGGGGGGTDTVPNWVDVATFATGGDGSTGAPFSGWDAFVTWAANTTYYFKQGVYEYSTWPNMNFPNVRLIGEAAQGYSQTFPSAQGTVLKFTGTGEGVFFDGGPGPGNNDLIAGIYMEGFLIQGNANMTVGLRLRGIVNSIFKAIRVVTCSDAGLHCEYAIDNIFEQFICTLNYGGWGGTTPVNGIRLDTRSGVEGCNANTFLHPIIEGTTGSGILIVYGFNNYFEGGTVELQSGASGVGVELQANALNTSVESMDFEQNDGGDVIIGGIGNVFTACQFGSTASMHFNAPSVVGKNNTITGGLSIGTILIDSDCVSPTFLNHWHTGVVTDNCATTMYLNSGDGTTPDILRTSAQMSVAYRQGTALSVGDGDNHNVALPDGSWFEVSAIGLTSAFNIGGLTGGVDGREILILNGTGQDMGILNNEAGSSVGNKILCSGGGNTNLTGSAFQYAKFRYYGPGPYWLLLDHS